MGMRKSLHTVSCAGMTARLAVMSDNVETLRWRDGRLELIDQRALPARLEYASCASAAEVADAIRSMVVRGAPAIGCAAAFGVALEARREQHRTRAEDRKSTRLNSSHV